MARGIVNRTTVATFMQNVKDFTNHKINPYKSAIPYINFYSLLKVCCMNTRSGDRDYPLNILHDDSLTA